MKRNRPIGFWVVIITGLFLFIMLILGQTMAFINYDFTVSLGLQEPKDMVGDMGIAVNKGFGVGDTIIYAPILMFGLAGLWLKRPWGLLAMAGAFGITAYWPITMIFLLLYAKGAPGFNFTRFASYTIMLTTISLYGLWGLWYLLTRRKILIEE